MKQTKLLLILSFFFTFHLAFSQDEATQSEISRKKGLVYYEGRPFSGWLYSDQTISSNECECTLKARYKNGKKNGLMQEWYTNGRLKYKGKYKNNYKIGTHNYYYKNGKPKLVEKYKSGGVVEKTYYFNNGTPKKYEKYRKGELVESKNLRKKKQEQTVVAEDNTQQQETATEETNTYDTILLTSDDQEIIPPKKADGLQKILFTNGSPKRIIFYKNGLIAIDSLFTIENKLKLVKVLDEGELIHKEEYNDEGVMIKMNNYKNSEKDGDQKEFFDNGKVKKMEQYENGKKVYLAKYYENGNLKLEENYKNSEKNGERNLYDENGNINFKQLYKNGILITEKSYTNGILILETAKYDNGKTKKIIDYYNNGKIKQKKLYNQQGEQVRYLVYNSNGVLTNSEEYDEKSGIKIVTTYTPNGNKLKEIAYKDNKKIREGSYKNNEKHGQWVEYAEDGKSEIRIEYKEGKEAARETIIYARQIKNNIGTYNYLYKYKTFLLNDKYQHFYIVKFKCGSSSELECDMSDEVMISLKNKIKSALNMVSTLEPVNNIEPVKEKMLEGEFLIKNIRFRHKPKSSKPNNKKFALQLTFTIEYKNFNTGENEVKDYLYPENPTNLKYSSDKEKYIEYTMEEVNIYPFIKKRCFPRKAHLLSVIKKSDKKVEMITASFGENTVQRKDIFYIYDENNYKNNAKLKVVKTLKNQSLLDVIKGGEWLMEYFKTEKHPVITEKDIG